MVAEHNSLVLVPKRPLMEEEHKWVRDIISANPDWADVSLGDLCVIKQCKCGCRTVVFEEPPFVQNPKVSRQQDVVGEIDIHISFEKGRDDYVSVLLHHSWGKLTYLEVVWYNFPEPVPAHWIELGREVRAGGGRGEWPTP
jgi:hypothetical protein